MEVESGMGMEMGMEMSQERGGGRSGKRGERRATLSGDTLATNLHHFQSLWGEAPVGRDGGVGVQFEVVTILCHAYSG